MSIYEFYSTYILTGKAIFLTCVTLYPIKTYLNTSARCIECKPAASRPACEFPYDTPISSLPHYGIKIALITDPIFVEASTLTGVISIPVPMPDDLPF